MAEGNSAGASWQVLSAGKTNNRQRRAGNSEYKGRLRTLGRGEIDLRTRPPMLHSEWGLRELPLASAEMLVFDIEPLPSNNSSKARNGFDLYIVERVAVFEELRNRFASSSGKQSSLHE